MRENSEIVDIVTSLYKQKGWNLSEFARKLGMPKSSLSRYLNKNRQFPINKTEIFADKLNTSVEYILGLKLEDKNTPPAPQNTTDKISDEVIKLDKELKDPRHSQWIASGEQLLKEQQAEQKARELKRQETSKPKKGIVSELFEERRQRQFEEEEKSVHAITGTTASAAASGLGRGYGYDDSDTYIVYTEEEPPKTYSFATMIKGDSMMPEYREGDMLYLHDKGVSSYSGQLAVVAYGDRTYFKKIYTENEYLRLVSLNEKYEDILLDFPPSEDTHIRIFEVVGSFTPIEE